LYSWDHVQSKSSKPENINKCFGFTEDRKSVPVVMKEIIMWGPKLKWLYDTIGPDLRIVWLVRDLRGWVSSWLPVQDEFLKSTEYFYNSWGIDTKDLWAQYQKCGVAERLMEQGFTMDNVTSLQNLLSNITDPPHKRMAAWWTVENALLKYYLSQIPSGNVMLLPYEQMSLYPMETTQQIYHFLGKPVVPAAVIEWLSNHTSTGFKTEEHGRYGTSRQSEAMAKIWWERLTSSEVLDVEDIGGRLFDGFGYTSAKSLIKSKRMEQGQSEIYRRPSKQY